LSTDELPEDICRGLRDLSLEVVPAGFVTSLVIQPMLMDRIREAQRGDQEIEDIRSALKEGKVKEFSEDEQGTIWFEK
jgi:hypothetical protein